ncbi:MAG: ComEC/Rec2 family competence protein [Parcubacteria group bacterium]
MKRNRAIIWFVILVLTIIVIVSFSVVSFMQGDGLLHVYFLNVGQGDAIFIVTPDKQQILIDGGPNRTVLRELGDVMPFYDRTIDIVAITHPDSDHINGLIDVLDRYKVENIIGTGVECNTSQCDIWEKIIIEEEANINYAHAGYRVRLDNDIVLEVLHPFESMQGREAEDFNDTSLVMKLIYGDHSLLLTGDIEAPTERRMPFLIGGLDSDFIKLAHHGSNTSSTQEFLEAVSPEIAFIQAGENNRYNHPHEDVINRLAQLSIPYYRTDIDGRIELVLDGHNYLIKTK